MFKKITLGCALAGILLAAFFMAASVSADSAAQGIAGQLQAAGGQTGYSAPMDPRNIAVSVIKVVLGLLGTIFFALTLYAGFLWMTAGGEEEKAKKAQTLLKQAVIGLLIIMLSYGITLFVVKVLTGQLDESQRYRPEVRWEGF